MSTPQVNRSGPPCHRRLRCIVVQARWQTLLTELLHLTSVPAAIAFVAGAGVGMTRVNAYPLLIEFVSGTRITREPEVVSKLPILQNGPPGTSVVFGDGAEVPLPTDQIVFADDGGGAAHVGFGGMSFEGIEGGQLVFLRVRDLQPEALLSPQRGRRMTLEPQMVASIAVDGRIVWPQ
jgi:hypothetical protein